MLEHLQAPTWFDVAIGSVTIYSDLVDMGDLVEEHREGDYEVVKSNIVP